MKISNVKPLIKKSDIVYINTTSKDVAILPLVNTDEEFIIDGVNIANHKCPIYVNSNNIYQPKMFNSTVNKKPIRFRSTESEMNEILFKMNTVVKDNKIAKVIMTQNSLSSKNTIVYIPKLLSNINTKVKTITSKKIAWEYIESVISSTLLKLNHKYKVISVNLNDSNTDVPMVLSSLTESKYKSSNVKNLLLYAIKYHYNDLAKLLSSEDIYIIFHNDKSFFYFQSKDMIPHRNFYSKFETLYRMIRTNSVDIKLSDPEVIEKHIDDKIEVIKAIEDVNQAVENIGSDNITDDIKDRLDIIKSTVDNSTLDLIDDLGLPDEIKTLKHDLLSKSSVDIKSLSPNQIKLLKQSNEKIKSVNYKTDDSELSLVPYVMDKVPDISGANTNTAFSRLSDYDDKLRYKDLEVVANSFIDTDTPMLLQKMTVKKSTSTVDYVDDVQFTFTDLVNNTKHTFTIAIPKFKNGKTLHLANGDKNLIAQITPAPIIKLGERVAVTTNHNKVFVSLRGKYTDAYVNNIDKINRYIDDDNIAGFKKSNHEILMTAGCFPASLVDVAEYLTTFEYNDVKIDLSNLEIKNDKIIIGRRKTTDIVIDTKTETVTLDNMTFGISEIILELMLISIKDDKKYNDVYKKCNSVSSTKSLKYSSAMIMGNKVPLVYLLLLSENGVIGVLDLLVEMNNLEYETIMKTSDNGRLKKTINKYNQGIIELMDRWLIITYNTNDNSIILAPLINDSGLKYYEPEQLLSDTSLAVDEMVGKDNFSLYIYNFINLMISPDIAALLERYDMPTTFGGVFVYASNLLNIPFIGDDKDISMSRLRRNDIIPAITYNVMAKYFEEYTIAKKRGARNPSFSMPKNAIVKAMSTLNTVNEASVTNPIQELDDLTTATMKGLLGLNLDQGYTIPKRMFDDSQVGIMSMVSPYSASNGIVKHMAVDANITNLRGDVQPVEPGKQIAKQVTSVSEALSPYATLHDSTARLMMGMAQYNHMITTVGAKPLRVSMGFDESMVYLTDNFAIKAEDDCVVIEKTPNFIKVKLSNGEIKSYKINRIGRNSAKSSFTDLSYQYVKGIKKGSKIKKNDVMCYHKGYFVEGSRGDISLKIGPIVNVAIMFDDGDYEDGTVISDRLSKQLGHVSLHRIPLLLPTNINILEANTDIGTDVETVNKPLFSYAPLTDDDMINKYLGDDDQAELTKIVNFSKYNGKLREINIHYAPSNEHEIHKSVTKFINKVKKVSDEVYDNKNMERDTDNDVVDINRNSIHIKEVKPDTKLNGVMIPAGKMLIEFFVEEIDNVKVGDKIVFSTTALKGIVSDVVDDVDMPRTIDTDIQIDAFLATTSPIARLVTSIYKMGLTYKILDKMDEELFDILGIE